MRGYILSLSHTFASRESLASSTPCSSRFPTSPYTAACAFVHQQITTVHTRPTVYHWIRRCWELSLQLVLFCKHEFGACGMCGGHILFSAIAALYIPFTHRHTEVFAPNAIQNASENSQHPNIPHHETKACILAFISAIRCCSCGSPDCCRSSISDLLSCSPSIRSASLSLFGT